MLNLDSMFSDHIENTGSDIQFIELQDCTSGEMVGYRETIRTARTHSGIVRGIRGNNPVYTVFKGIPYAQPPVGKLRWRPPMPVKSWGGEYLAFEYKNTATQPCRYDEPLYGKEFFQNKEASGEDCLYLNVWTPAKSVEEKLPVLFWIHGGGYFGGSGTEPEFDGEGFCKRGVILVTINYRLGALGFLAHPQLLEESENNACGNYGLLDQIAALKWVRQNIDQFGGNPDNITIFGQSAGAGSVQALICSPLTRGDIKGAIMQSGGGVRKTGLRAGLLAQALEDGVRFAACKGCKTIKELRSLPAEELITSMYDDIRFGPVVDGFVLKAQPSDIIMAGEHHPIQYMVGNTSNEGAGPFGEDMTRDMTIANLTFAQLALEKGQLPCYIYLFDRDIPGDDHRGAFHAGELWYLFQTLDRCWRPFIGKDYEVAAAMADYWANFAKYGNPNGKGLPRWEPFTKETPQVMEIGEGLGMMPADGN